MIYLSKGGFWLLLGRVFNMAAGLILTVAFANLLTKDAYGTYQFIMTAAAIIGVLTLSNMGTAITRAVAQGREGALRYGFRTQLKWSVGMIAIGGVLSIYYFLNENNTLALSFLIVGSLSPFLVGFRLFNSHLIGKQFFKESTVLGLWRKPIPLVALLLGVFFTNNPVILVGIYFLSSTLSAGLLYLLIIHKYQLPLERDANLINFTKHLSVIGLINIVGNNLDKILLFHFLGAVPLAIYTLGQLPIKHIEKTFSLIYQMTLPKMSKVSFSELQQTLPRKARIAFFATACAVGVYILAAPYLFNLLFPNYPESVIFTQVLALLVLSMPRGFYVQALTAHAMKKEIYMSRLCVSVLNIIFLLILLPLYGIWGAVSALLASHFFSNILIRFLFNRARVAVD
jgi:O-antigen/teichoic acid export membrane protein